MRSPLSLGFFHAGSENYVALTLKRVPVPKPPWPERGKPPRIPLLQRGTERIRSRNQLFCPRAKNPFYFAVRRFPFGPCHQFKSSDDCKRTHSAERKSFCLKCQVVSIFEYFVQNIWGMTILVQAEPGLKGSCLVRHDIHVPVVQLLLDDLRNQFNKLR